MGRGPSELITHLKAGGWMGCIFHRGQILLLKMCNSTYILRCYVGRICRKERSEVERIERGGVSIVEGGKER